MPKVQQSGGGSGGRGRRGVRVSTSLAEINVVPLIDVMLVLLIIFMVTAPMMQQGLEVNLPQARRANPVNSEPVYVTVPRDFATSQRVQLGEETIPVDVLPERVRQALASRDDKSVYVRPDAAANMQDFFDVTDRLKEGGVDKIALMSKPRETRDTR